MCPVSIYVYAHDDLPKLGSEWTACDQKDHLLCISRYRKGAEKYLNYVNQHPMTPILGSQVFSWKVTSPYWAVWGGHPPKYWISTTTLHLSKAVNCLQQSGQTPWLTGVYGPTHRAQNTMPKTSINQTQSCCKSRYQLRHTSYQTLYLLDWLLQIRLL